MLALSQNCNVGQLQCFNVQFKELKYYKFGCQDEIESVSWETKPIQKGALFTVEHDIQV